MRRNWLRDRPPRPWSKPSGIWGNLSLAADGIFEPKAKPKPGETAIKVCGEIPVMLCNALARKGFLRRSQVEQKDETAIFGGMVRAIEDMMYDGVRVKRY